MTTRVPAVIVPCSKLKVPLIMAGALFCSVNLPSLPNVQVAVSVDRQSSGNSGACYHCDSRSVFRSIPPSNTCDTVTPGVERHRVRPGEVNYRDVIGGGQLAISQFAGSDQLPAGGIDPNALLRRSHRDRDSRRRADLERVCRAISKRGRFR
jgi:hypothetical protein